MEIGRFFIPYENVKKVKEVVVFKASKLAREGRAAIATGASATITAGLYFGGETAGISQDIVVTGVKAGLILTSICGGLIYTSRR